MTDGRRGRAACGIWLAAALLVAAAGCTPRYEPQRRGEGPGGREQHLALNPRQELEVGRRAYQEVMQEYGKAAQPASSPDARRCRRVMERLAKAAAIEPLQREINLHIRGYRFEWEVNVIRSQEINAFCLPAGKMFVFTGILKVIGDSDDFLATVISHEMAHALAHHASERIARDRDGGGVLRKLSYERGQESEADHVGVFLMAFADFDPRQAPVFWERMMRLSAGRGRRPEWLSDHPSDERRVRALRDWAPYAIKAREAYDQGRVLPGRP